ncbi:MAG: hypothetical protein KW806_00625 [Candidatus Yanofskybacteria bacterium]|nr:hypothetical protein [Candidatus Yanofskybacteria bacterium]
MVRTKGRVARALNLSLFQVSMPSQSSQQSARDLMSMMEKLYVSFANLHAWGWNKFAYGEPYLSLEMAMPHIGDRVHFYMAIPRSYESMFEKQLKELYPQAQLERVRDYNIFNHRGVVAGGYVQLQSSAVVPLNSYTRMERDPLSSLIAALSKLEKEGEGAALQILIRPSHRQDMRDLAQKVTQEIQMGHTLQEALSRAHSSRPLNKRDPALVPANGSSNQAVVELIQAKATRPLFDTNIRIMVSAGDEARAQQILSQVTGSLSEFSGQDLNSFQTHLFGDKALEKLIFDFSFRMFEKTQVVPLSSEELASLYHFPAQA